MRSRILTPRTAGILGITGLTVSATVGFAMSAMADSGSITPSKSAPASPTQTTPTTSKSGSSPGSSSSSAPASPTTTPDSTAVVTLSGPESVKSHDTATYTVTMKVENGPLKKAALTPGGSWHGGTVEWTDCPSVDGVTCNLSDVANGTKTYHLTYSAPKFSKNTSVQVTLTRTATGANGDALASTTKTLSLLVKKAPAPTPTKTKTPTKSSKPTASHKPSHKPKPAPSDNGNVPLPDIHPNVPSSVPSIPAGTQPPLPNGSPTDLPKLPSVAPSPEGSPRVPNVAEPPRKASGEVQTDAVSLPAAAAAAFLGLGAGTLITRSVRRRGLMRTIGRHRD